MVLSSLEQRIGMAKLLEMKPIVPTIVWRISSNHQLTQEYSSISCWLSSSQVSSTEEEESRLRLAAAISAVKLDAADGSSRIPENGILIPQGLPIKSCDLSFFARVFLSLLLVYTFLLINLRGPEFSSVASSKKSFGSWCQLKPLNYLSSESIKVGRILNRKWLLICVYYVYLSLPLQI